MIFPFNDSNRNIHLQFSIWIQFLISNSPQIGFETFSMKRIFLSKNIFPAFSIEGLRDRVFSSTPAEKSIDSYYASDVCHDFTSRDFFNLIYVNKFLTSTLFSFNYDFIVEGSEWNWIGAGRLTRFFDFWFFFHSRLASLQFSREVSRVFVLQRHPADVNLLHDTATRFDFFSASIERRNCLLQ